MPQRSAERPPDSSDRDRSISAYAAEVRAFHAFFGAVLILLAGVYLFVLLPYTQFQATVPALADAVSNAEQAVKTTTEAEHAVAASTAALEQFRRILKTAPGEFRSAVGYLVARGRETAARDGNPYTATIRLPRGTPGLGRTEDESITVEDAIRRQIGKQIEALAVAFDAAIEPLRMLQNAPEEVASTIRIAEEGVGHNIMALRDVLGDAFSNDPRFWERISDEEGTFGPVSPRAEEWTKGTADAIQRFEGQLASAATMLKTRGRAAQARVVVAGERYRTLRDRFAEFAARLAWLPLGIDGLVRIHPVVAGGLALTVLFRLRRLLLLRSAIGGVALDIMAPSWVVGASSAPGRWWAVVLVSLPVLATAHASLLALEDPKLFAGLLGDPDFVRMTFFAVVYAAFCLAGTWQLVKVGQGILVGQRAPEN